jgi:hypothetical protein
MFTVYNIVAYQAAWFACVLGAAYGMPWIGAAVSFVVVAAHLALTRQWAVELKLIGAAIFVGLLVDTALLRSGHLWFVSGTWPEAVAPYWVLSLWGAFATTLNYSLRRCTSRHRRPHCR